MVQLAATYWEKMDRAHVGTLLGEGLNLLPSSITLVTLGIEKQASYNLHRGITSSGLPHPRSPRANRMLRTRCRYNVQEHVSSGSRIQKIGTERCQQFTEPKIL